MNEANLKPVNDKKGRILAVEDDSTSLLVLVGLLEDLGYEVLEATEGREALDIVEREGATLDVIVLDKVMPEMDGLEVVAQLKDDPKAQHIPIIMVTGSTKPEEVKEGIDAGVFYYLTKPYEDNVFKSVLTSAMREADRRSNLKGELKKHQTSFGFIDRADFTIQKLEEAEDLACFIANCFPNPDTALPGLASLLVNAVEHGNLEVGYEKKSEFLSKNMWREMVECRFEQPAFQSRSVHVQLSRNDKEVRVTIEDQGKGFDWKQYLEIDPARALDSHGRGIAQANKISFDELQYNEKGNVVTAISNIGSGIKW